ncbi:MAG: hypothetical protein IT366_03985 [Candidatus Hydrogenedentes bacterium]|nr:hypothetical protein [Candidatus Hydrogenedentota bacterium]
MAQDRQENSPARVRELEDKVAQLTRELDALRAGQRSSDPRGRRIGDPLPKPPPPLGRAWTIRGIMLLMTFAIAAAVTVNYSLRDLDLHSGKSIVRGMAEARVNFALLTCGVSAMLALFLYHRRALGFAFFAVCAVYPAFALYLVHPVSTFGLSGRTYVWIAFALLTLFHVLVSTLCVMESRRIGRGRGRSALTGTMNSLAYYPIVWYGLATYDASRAGLVYGVLCGISVLLAIYAEGSGTHRNYLFQIFIGAALLLFNFALSTAVDGPWFLAALALECLLLAALHHTTGIIVLKAGNIVVLIVTFVLTMQAMKFTGPLYVGDRALQSNWVQGLFAVGVFLATAWYYATHIRGIKPHHRKLSGHWFLADTMFDVPPMTASLLHAAAAALLLMLLFISDLGDMPSLPFLLAVASAALAITGLALRTPQMEVAAVMLIIASHVSFYFFLYVEKEGFREQPFFTLFTTLLAVYTFIGGYRSERYLARISGGRSADHHAAASIPYIIAVGSVSVLLHRFAGQHYAPLAIACLGVVLSIAGVLLRTAGLKLGAVAALCVSAGMWFYTLTKSGHALELNSGFWIMTASLIIAGVFVERCFPWRRPGESTPGTVDHIAQVAALFIAGAIGAGTLGLAADGDWRATLLFAHAFLWIVLCVLIPEREYRWTTLLLVIGSAIWLAARQRAAQPDSSVTVFVACGGVFLALLCAVWFFFPRSDEQGPHRLAPGK